MRIMGFNRVELIVADRDIERAVRQFNDVLGMNLPDPIRIERSPVVSSTDFDGGIEFVAPTGPGSPIAAKLESGGAGQIGPLVWEIADIDEARAWLEEHGYRIRSEYDSRTGTAEEQVAAVYQLMLDPEQWFGFSVTLMQRFRN